MSGLENLLGVIANLKMRVGRLETLETALSSAWDGAHLVLGVYHIWIDATGDLRIKSGAPANDVDGTVVGTQS